MEKRKELISPLLCIFITRIVSSSSSFFKFQLFRSLLLKTYLQLETKKKEKIVTCWFFSTHTHGYTYYTCTVGKSVKTRRRPIPTSE